MKYTPKDFSGAYHIMPNSVCLFLSGDAFKVFTEIYAHGCKIHNETLTEDNIMLSVRIICKLTHLGSRKVNDCIRELEEFNFIRVFKRDRSQWSFQIIWNEIHKLHTCLSNISYDGQNQLYDICHKNGKRIPISAVDNDILTKITADYKLDAQTAVKSVNNAEITADDKDNSTGMCSAVEKDIITNTTSAAVKNDKNANITADKNATAVKSVNNAEITAANHICSVNQVEDIDGKVSLIVPLSSAERFIAKKMGFDQLVFLTADGQTAVISAQNDSKLLSDLQVSPKTCNFSSTVNIYKDNKENQASEARNNKGENKNENDENDDEPVMLNDEERDWNNFFSFSNSFLEHSFNGKENVFGKGHELPVEDKKDFGLTREMTHTSRTGNKLVWNETRDLTLQCYTEKEIQSIMDNSQFYDSDEDKLIRMVWNDLAPSIDIDNKDEYENQENRNDDILPVIEFNRELAEALEELRQDSDFQLTDKQAKNIFGFDVVQTGDEFSYVLAPNKIRKLKNDTDEATTIPEWKRKSNRRRGAEGRKEITTFLDCIEELSKDESSLTSTEMLVHLISQYAGKDSWTSDTGYEHKPNEEVPGLILPDLITEWSEQSGLSEENIMAILKKLPHRNGRTILHPQHLSVSDIISMNEQTNEDSEVERLYAERMKEG